MNHRVLEVRNTTWKYAHCKNRTGTECQGLTRFNKLQLHNQSSFTGNVSATGTNFLGPLLGVQPTSTKENELCSRVVNATGSISQRYFNFPSNIFFSIFYNNKSSKRRPLRKQFKAMLHIKIHEHWTTNMWKCLLSNAQLLQYILFPHLLLHNDNQKLRKTQPPILLR